MVVGESDHLHNWTKLNDVQEKLRSRVGYLISSNKSTFISIYALTFYFITLDLRIRVLVAKI